jgi:hypothetical protein
LADGRSAVRSVDSAEALTFTAEALLIVPKLPRPSAPAAPVQQEPSPASDMTETARVPAPLSERPVHVFAQVSMIGHLAGVPAVVGGGLSLHLGVRWRMIFLEVAPRWEPQTASLRMRLSDFEMHEMSVAILSGWRFWSSIEGAAEVGAGALIVSEDQTYRPVSNEVGGTLIDGQVTAFARLLWGSDDVRWAISADLTLAPARLSHPARIRDIFPPLPVFGIGFGFGVHWESS